MSISILRKPFCDSVKEINYLSKKSAQTLVQIALLEGAVRLWFSGDLAARECGDTAYSRSFVGEGESPASMACVSIRDLYKVTKAAEAAHIEIANEGDRIVVKDADMTYSIATVPADVAAAYRPVQDVDPVASFSINSCALFDTFGKVKHAISEESTRYYLGGVYMIPGDGAIKAVTTDGHRLAIVDVAAQFIEGKVEPFIFPASSVASCLRLCKPRTKKDNGHDVIFSMSPGMRFVKVEIGDHVLHVENIDGTFPDYTQVLLSKRKYVARFDVSEMRGKVKKVRVMCDTVNGGAIGLQKDRIDLVVVNGGTSAKTSVSAEARPGGSDLSEYVRSFEGVETHFGVDLRYFQEALEQIETEFAEIGFCHDTAPVELRPEGSTDLFLVMPCRR